MQFNLSHKCGYKGTSIETILYLICILSTLTALLTLERFDEQTDLPEPKFMHELYILLTNINQLNSREMSSKKRKKMGIFASHLPKMKDAGR